MSCTKTRAALLDMTTTDRVVCYVMFMKETFESIFFWGRKAHTPRLSFGILSKAVVLADEF